MKKKEKRESSRLVALRCLLEWEQKRQPVQKYIDSVIHGSSLNQIDRHLSFMLVLGVLRQLQYLDSVISRHSKYPLEKMKPLTLMALRVGVYQIMFLDRIPDSAAVNETVKALKLEKQPRWLVNFANGVLRSISRNKSELPGPTGSLILNHPQWLLNRWQKRYGKATTEQICQNNNREPFVTIRVNTRVTTMEKLSHQFAEAGIEVKRGKFSPEALVLQNPVGPVTGLPGYNERCFHVQDESAQLVTELLGPFCEGGIYLDACAGLGGKTITLAQLLPKECELYGVEPNDHRFQLLKENLKRMGLDTKVHCLKGKLEDLIDKMGMQFHGILVDAPCSGTGVIGRHPDIRWNRKQEDLAGYQHQQLDILNHSVKLLRPGGILVYATCSMEPEENEQVVDRFMDFHADLVKTDAKKYLPGSAHRLINEAGYFSTTPADGLDGFFAARLQKKG